MLGLCSAHAVGPVHSASPVQAMCSVVTDCVCTTEMQVLSIWLKAVVWEYTRMQGLSARVSTARATRIRLAPPNAQQMAAR